MGALETPDLPYPGQLPDYRSASPATRPPQAKFGSRWLTMTTEIVTVQGDVDATNAGALTEYALDGPISRRALIVDLRGLGFCGVQGFSALCTICAGCAATRTRWVMVPSPAVSRLLTLCDRAGALPCADTITAALTRISDQRHLPDQPDLRSVTPGGIAEAVGDTSNRA